MIDLLHPRGVLITGLEVDPAEPGLWRAYLGHRSRCVYVLVGPDGAEKIRHAGSGHVTTVLPDDAEVYRDDAELAELEWTYRPWNEHP